MRWQMNGRCRPRTLGAAVCVAVLAGAAVSVASAQNSRVKSFGSGGSTGRGSAPAPAEPAQPATGSVQKPKAAATKPSAAKPISASSSTSGDGVVTFGGTKEPAKPKEPEQLPVKPDIAPPQSAVDAVFAQLISAMGAKPGDAKWNKSFDLNKNSVVDTGDVNKFLEELAKIQSGAAEVEDPQLKKLQAGMGSKVGDAKYDASFDMNADGVINSLDLNLFMAQMGGSGLVVDQNGIAVMGPEGTEHAPFVTGLDANGQLIVIDKETNKGIIVPNGQGVWYGSNQDPGSFLQPTINVQLAPGGMDVVYTYTNGTNKTLKPGAMRLGGIRFGQEIQGRKLSVDGSPRKMNHDKKAKWLSGQIYPNDLYSPVAILQEGEYTVGVSFYYPVLDYKHHVFVQYEAASDPKGYGINWQVRGTMNDGKTHFPESDIKPGEKRVYVMSVRVTKGDPDEWVRTLVPYRSFFQAEYGGTQYARDPKPILGMTPAMPDYLSAENPYGFGYPSIRPDVYGWEGWINLMQDQIDNHGWSRIVMKTPSGLYKKNQQFNFPTQIVSQWMKIPAMKSTIDEMGDFGNDFGGLGFWWGRSSTVMFKWDPTADEQALFEPSNPQHRELLFKELDLAAQAGVSHLGLDGFNKLRSWEGYQWIKDMEARQPGIKFCVEAVSCDLMHTVAPTYVWALRPESLKYYEVSQPHSLADFLVPGHETWAHIGGADLKAMYDLPAEADVPQAIVLDHMNKAAAMGYVPIIFSPADATKAMPAAESWKFSVPQDLQ